MYKTVKNMYKEYINDMCISPRRKKIVCKQWKRIYIYIFIEMQEYTSNCNNVNK